MYLRHFAFTRLPFATPAHTDELFESASRREAEARLNHLIELRGIGLLTGEVGSGKTTVCRHVTGQLHPGLYRVCYVSLSTGNVIDMYKCIGWELGLPGQHYRAAAYRAIQAEITRLVCEAKQQPVLVIDEAHHLRNDVLEDLRLLTNFDMDCAPRLCLLLIGLTELRRRLAMSVHESLAQRLIVRHHLRGLDREELDAYLTHRLRLAGCELPLFEPPAVEALFQSARGLPRLINRIAHYALSAAALDNARTVNVEPPRPRARRPAPMIALDPWPEKLSDETVVILAEYLQRIADGFLALHRDRIPPLLPSPPRTGTAPGHLPPTPTASVRRGVSAVLNRRRHRIHNPKPRPDRPDHAGRIRFTPTPPP